METVSVNLSGKVREEVLNGRRYLVVPVSMLVPGVLAGSDGPLYYPPEPVGRDPLSWNGMPIVLDHPTDKNGKPVSARQPHILEKYGVGAVYKAGFEGKLAGEAWFDYERTRELAPKVFQAIKAGEPVEVSTGLYPLKDAAPEGATLNGKAYTHVVRDIKPDHLAVLTDRIGACSIADGCGVHVNALGEPVGVAHAVRQLLAALGLVTNPMAHEHSARVATPDDFLKNTFRRKELGKGISAVMGKKQAGGPMMIQSYRFDASKFTADEAKKWLKDHDIKALEFAAAKKPTGNAAPTDNDMSHEQLRQELAEALMARASQADPACYVVEVYDDYCVYEQGGTLYKVGYKASDTGAELDGEPVAARREVTYVPAADGGAGTSEGQGMAMSANDRKAVIDRLTANCDCYKGDGARGRLEKLTDDQLRAAETLGPAVNSILPPPPVAQPVPPPPPAPQRPREEEEALAWARAEQARQKDDIVKRLTANAAGDAERQKASAVYAGMSLAQLQDLAAALPPAPPAPAQNANPVPVPLYFGAAPPAGTQAKEPGDNVLPMPTTNYAELASAGLRRARA